MLPKIFLQKEVTKNPPPPPPSPPKLIPPIPRQTPSYIFSSLLTGFGVNAASSLAKEPTNHILKPEKRDNSENECEYLKHLYKICVREDKVINCQELYKDMNKACKPRDSGYLYLPV
jgi:hypothetical protein